MRHGLLLGLAAPGRCPDGGRWTSPASSWPPRGGCRSRVGPVFPLVQADAERVPLADGRFDLVVSEHGAAAWCDPERWLPEAARLLRPGGRLVFLTNSHLSALCVPAEEGVAEERLLRGQREAYRVQWPGGGVEFHPSHGDWVRLLRAPGSSSRPCTRSTRRPTAPTTRSTRSCRRDWATRWPAEELWVTCRTNPEPVAGVQTLGR